MTLNRKRVFISGPPGIDRLDIAVAEALFQRGHMPYLPNLHCQWQQKYPHTPNEWYSLHLAFLDQCQAMISLPGETPSSPRERQHAQRIGLLIFEDLKTFFEWADGDSYADEEYRI